MYGFYTLYDSNGCDVLNRAQRKHLKFQRTGWSRRKCGMDAAEMVSVRQVGRQAICEIPRLTLNTKMDSRESIPSKKQYFACRDGQVFVQPELSLMQAP